MNSKLILLLLCFHLFIISDAQNLSKDVRQDFCKNAVLNYEYGTDMFRTWMNQSARAIGIQTPYEIEEAVQNICNNIKLQEEFFKSIDKLGGSREFKEQQYISIGMKPYNAKLLNDYMIAKLSSKIIEKKEIHENEFTNQIKSLSNFTLLKMMYPEAKTTKDSTIALIQNDNLYYITLLKKLTYHDENMNMQKVLIVTAVVTLINGREKRDPYINLAVVKDFNSRKDGVIFESRGNLHWWAFKNSIYTIENIFGSDQFAIGYSDDVNEKGDIKMTTYKLNKERTSAISHATTYLNKQEADKLVLQNVEENNRADLLYIDLEKDDELKKYYQEKTEWKYIKNPLSIVYENKQYKYKVNCNIEDIKREFQEKGYVVYSKYQENLTFQKKDKPCYLIEIIKNRKRLEVEYTNNCL